VFYHPCKSKLPPCATAKATRGDGLWLSNHSPTCPVILKTTGQKATPHYSKMSKHRIELLDSFRFIAIMAVLLYHLTDSWLPLYPYGNFFNHIFKYGYLGVNFFFIISGFVISYTLENTASLASFYRNRFSRLFPAMLLCTVITFIVICLLDDRHLFKNAHEIKNFIPSLTFINPTLWTLVTGVNFHWINGSYWSLWTEIQFYLIASGLYFLNKKHFFRNVLLAGIMISFIKYIPICFLNDHTAYTQMHGLNDFFEGWRYGNEVFNLTFYITWFMAGIVFHQLYKGFSIKQNRLQALLSVITLFCLVRDLKVFFATSFFATIIGCLIMFILFLLMIYNNKYLFFLKIPFLSRIGIISYSIYLIHEEIGVLLINKYGKYLYGWSALSPFIVIIIAICFAELSYRFYEKRISRFIKTF
jgi:peptidoglycan/LPS O-acetylase OafA/YrhL